MFFSSMNRSVTVSMYLLRSMFCVHTSYRKLFECFLCTVTGLSLFISVPLMAFIVITYTALVTAGLLLISIIVNNDSVCLTVPMSRCLRLSRCSFKLILLFVSRRNRAIFSRLFSMWHSTKRCSYNFDLGPLTPKIYSPKFGTKSPISRLVWQIYRRCLLAYQGGFRGWPIQ